MGVSTPSFSQVLRDHGVGPLTRARVKTLQVNVGKFCNMACHHCHVEAGPKRTEVMSRAVAGRVVELVAANPSIEVIDLTGGAPELNPSFRWLVTEMRRLGREVIDRCNLTVLFEPGAEDMAQFLAANEVRVVASLPCYQAENVEKQRGQGAFDKSIEALRMQVAVFSAGTAPAGVHPLATAVMAEVGIDISGQRSKSLSDIPLGDVDHIVTLCGDAAEKCPAVPGARRDHWPLRDPARATGSEAEVLGSFRSVRDEVLSRVRALASSMRVETPAKVES